MRRGVLALVPAALVLLAGCNITIRAGPRLGITTPTVSTEFVTSAGRAVICDDRETRVSYSFAFRTPLEGWTSSLVGAVEGEDLDSVRTLTPTSPNVRVSGDRISYTFTVRPQGAPFSVGEDLLPGLEPSGLEPLSIIVAPPGSSRPIGETTLVIRARDRLGNTYRVSAPPILVYDRCP